MDDEVSALHDGWSSGRLRIEGWVGETYDAYREAVGMLESGCRPISVGLVIVAGTAALESLMTDLLDEPNDIRLHNAGLRRAAGELGRRWSGVIDDALLTRLIEWLAERRNALAHRLTDGIESSVSGVTWQLDLEEAEEALKQVSQAAEILEVGWEAHVSANGR